MFLKGAQFQMTMEIMAMPPKCFATTQQPALLSIYWFVAISFLIFTIHYSCDHLFLDNEMPKFRSCPSNQIRKEIDDDACIATFVYTKPTATDNSGAMTVTCSPVSGSSLEIGTTSINCVARDSSGNQASCSFGVNVSGTFIV